MMLLTNHHHGANLSTPMRADLEHRLIFRVANNTPNCYNSNSNQEFDA